MAVSIAFLSLCVLPPPSSHLCARLHAPTALQLKTNAALSNPFSGSSLSLSLAKTQLPFISLPPQKHSKVAVFAKKKGYKVKTRKASAKRFRVTGTGKIVRRRAGKQHLLAKKNTKRKKRLSKMIQVKKSDYANVIGALPYLKVNRKAK